MVVFTGGEYLPIPAGLDADARRFQILTARNALHERMELRRRHESQNHPGLRVLEARVYVTRRRVTSAMTLVAPAR